MRWWCGPHETGWGREFCEEYCTAACQAETNDLCCFKAVDPIPSNAFAWQAFKDSIWQWSGNGFGDANINAMYVQQMMADRGVTGPERDEEMQRVRVLAEELHAMNAIRAKRKKKS